MTVGDLEIGDILVSKKHTEFYVGTNYETTFIDNAEEDKNIRKKSGIESMTSKNGSKVIEGNKIYGTFGWGSVHDEFPTENKNGIYTYFYKSPDEAYYRFCQCGLDPTYSIKRHSESNCDFGNEKCQYEIIWRKKD